MQILLFTSNKKTKEKLVEDKLLSNYNRYYRLAYSYVHNEADAGDIVQNGAYKAILNSDTLRQEQYVETWLYRIMLNEIFSFLRKPAMSSIDEVAETGREDTYENLDLARALDSLEKEDRLVIQLRYFEDMKLEEIAAILDENLSTVKSRLYRTIKKLRIKLEDDSATA
ncbi:MAG: sigma-70 family RNA polymerase sigma factor [Acetatifactor sp.]